MGFILKFLREAGACQLRDVTPYFPSTSLGLLIFLTSPPKKKEVLRTTGDEPTLPAFPPSRPPPPHPPALFAWRIIIQRVLRHQDVQQLLT